MSDEWKIEICVDRTGAISFGDDLELVFGRLLLDRELNVSPGETLRDLRAVDASGIRYVVPRATVLAVGPLMLAQTDGVFSREDGNKIVFGAEESADEPAIVDRGSQ